jgi:serine/threonine protein kinase
MDFGLARNADASQLTASGAALGTPRYMSPEHFRVSPMSPASDVYSVGVILYEMLSTRLPHDTGAEEVWSLMAQRLMVPPTPLSDYCPTLSPELCAAVMTMLATQPEHRYADASQAAAALASL